MNNEDKLYKASSDGAKAEVLLQNELLKKAHEQIEADLIAAWVASDPRDTEGREKAFMAVHANRKHRDFFSKVVTNGKLASAELRQIVETSERKRRFGIL